MRADLTPAERALHIDRRKTVYEALHPETKHGGTRNKGSSRQVGDCNNDRFTKDTAAKTGQSEREVQRDATRAKQLGDDLKRIAGTSLDKGTVYDRSSGDHRHHQYQFNPAPVASRWVTITY